jgi:bacillolysin
MKQATWLLRYVEQAKLLRLLCLAILMIGLSVPAQAQSPFRTIKGKTRATRAERQGSVVVSDQHLNRVVENLEKWTVTRELRAKHPELLKARGITMDQIIAYDKLKVRAADMKVHWADDSHLPIFIRGSNLYSPPLYLHKQYGSHDIAYFALEFMDQYKDLLSLQNPKEEFTLVDAGPIDESGRMFARFSQHLDGVQLWAKEVTVHFNAQGNVYLFTGRYAATPDTKDLAFVLNEQQAVHAATGDLSSVSEITPLSESYASLLEYDGPETEKVYFVDAGEYSAAYVVEIRPNLVDRWRYFIDAQDGHILQKYNASCSDGPEKAQATDLNGQTQTIDTYLHQGNYYLIDATRPMYNSQSSQFPDNTIGTIWTLTANKTDLKSISHVLSTDNTWSDPAAVSAHYNAALTYEYFRTVHNRNSIDDNGATIISVVHVTEQGQDMPNAFWNGKIMAYGDGGFGFSSFPAALDIGAHEMAHGVTERTANLEYLNQQGALNESFSDIFGAMVDRGNWLLGEAITPTNSNFPTGATRDMADPHNGGSQGSPSYQPKHMSEFQNLPTNQDNGGVHINSGIPNHAAYLLAENIGKEKMEKIMYNALTTKLTRQSQFIDFRLSIIQAATELYGAAEAAACGQACDQVGITDGNGSTDPDDLEPINSVDKMLIISNDPTDDYYMWSITYPGTSPSHWLSHTKTPPYSKPSISDDGSIALFVDIDFNLRILSLDPMNLDEQVLSDDEIWNTVAVSRDGNRVALTSIISEPTIYMFDFEGTTPRTESFPVYTPNYSEDGVPNTAMFADALDFSSDNENLIYDCLNRITIDGFEYNFWDINLIHVWDESTKQFGSGKIERIFGQDPRFDLSFPSFSKNSPFIFAFDVYDNNTDRTFVFAADLNEQVFSPVIELYSQDQYSYPSYSGDDKILSFSAVPYDGPFTDAFVILNQEMQNDKMTPIGEAQVYLPLASVPIWYRQGQRPVNVERPALPAGGFDLSQNFPNPFNPGTTIQFNLLKASHVTLMVFDRMGRLIRTLNDGFVEAGAHSFRWDGRGDNGKLAASGMYFYRLVSGEQAQTRSMILSK